MFYVFGVQGRTLRPGRAADAGAPPADPGRRRLAVTDDAGRIAGFLSRSDILHAVVTEPPLNLWS